MDKLSKLRRSLILRLIVFELDLYGKLDIIEPFILGTATALTEYLKKIEGSLTLQDFSAVAKAKIGFACYANGIIKEKSPSLDGTSVAIPVSPQSHFGSIPFSLFTAGKAFSTTTLKPLLGFDEYSSLIFGTAVATTLLSACKGQDQYKYQLSGFPVSSKNIKSSGATMENFCIVDGYVKLGTPKGTYGTLCDSIYPTAFVSVYTEGNGLYGARATFFEGKDGSSGAATATKNNLPLRETLKTSLSLVGHMVKDEVLAFCRKLIEGSLGAEAIPNLKFEKDLSPSHGALFISIGASTSASIYTDGNGLQGVKAIFFEGGVDSFGTPMIDTTLPSYRYFIEGDIKAETEASLRYKDALLPLQSNCFYDNLFVKCSPSYQRLRGVLGNLDFSVGFPNGLAECHTTMHYTITPDEENGGEIYEITTKYCKEDDGSWLIGWRYFGYLIE